MAKLADFLKENKKKFVLCLIVIISFFVGFGIKSMRSVSLSEYHQLEDKNDDLAKLYKELNDDYTQYKTNAEAYQAKMQPYEEQQAADEKAREEQAAAEKAAKEQAEAEQKAVNESVATSIVRENIIGKSDKNVDTVDSNFSVSDVRNDKTGKWRISKISANMQVQDYALSYYKKYFKNDNEVHWIVNFANKTTNCITYMNGNIFVDVYEYVDKEEHYADTLGGGMTLAKFTIYTDNGDIEQTK